MGSINNLKNLKTYLVGAMDRVADGGVGWRTKITPVLKSMNLHVLDPCQKLAHKITESESTRQKIAFYKKTEQYDKIKEMYSNIRNVDLRCVDVSDFLICHIDISVHMCGSYEEIVTANRQKKPILIWCEQGKKNIPNWLFFMLPHEQMFSSCQELISYLHQVDNSTNLQSLKRWIFLEQK